MRDSTSQPSSWTAKLGKFISLSRAIEYSDIYLEVLSLQNRKSFEYFFCFYLTLGISPKDLEGFKADIAFIYMILAGDFHKFELSVDLCNAKFHWFVHYQMRVLIG